MGPDRQTLNIFDSRGGLLPLEALDADAIAELSPERKLRFDGLRAAAETSAEAEAELKAAEKDLSHAVKVEAVARQDLLRIRPPKTFHSLWLETFKG